ncbi:MAG: flavodoxin family protein [Chitinivibrionales bacterium]|nr:flavodoxin family protein [Chitinivibrionales bacterium]MBD3356214.1 flavodoxin family protein [Chitinivibrionales bacterium]
MKIFLILAHPNTKSFNHAVAQTAAEQLWFNGHEIFYHDLYQESFDPVLSFEEIAKDAQLPEKIAEHCEQIARADGVIVVHPNWWGQPPAILKGWVDRVIRPGVAYEFVAGDGGEGVPKGLLRAETALVFNTSNTEKRRERTVFGDPLETIWKNCIFGLCGVNDFYRRTFATVVTSNEELRKEWLEETKRTVDSFFPPMNRAGEKKKVADTSHG